MAEVKAAHLVETCLIKDIEEHLEVAVAAGYDLSAMSSHQVGAGFGAYVQAVLVFKLRHAAEETNGKRNGVLPGQRGAGAFAKKLA